MDLGITTDMIWQAFFTGLVSSSVEVLKPVVIGMVSIFIIKLVINTVADFINPFLSKRELKLRHKRINNIIDFFSAINDIRSITKK